ncbi:MAG: taurine dioxygenase [Deltaproteobacteria bacterium]|nr:taurine dioxygenase [Deltaproteobacteria bacterium]
MSIEIEPVSAEIGAVVHGVDLTKPLAPEVVKEISQALLDHLALIFFDQPLTEERHIALARQFGEIQPPPLKTRHNDDVLLHVMDQTSPKGEGADNWHTDNTYISEPPMGSILRAVQMPSKGGDTLLGSMYAAYDALSEPMRTMLDGLTAEHDVSKSARRGIRGGHIKAELSDLQKRLPPVTHPVIRTHPVTARKCLFVHSNSTVRINELEEDESQCVLDFLFQHVHKPEFQVRHRWRNDSVVFFDNRCTQHYAVPDYTERRILHRVTIKGDRPF